VEPSVQPPVAPTPGATLELSDETVLAGTEIQVFGEGFMGDSPVVLSLHSTPVFLKSVVAAADGTFTTTVTVPAGTATGLHSVVADGVDPADAPFELSAALTVVAPTPPPTDSLDGGAPLRASSLLIAIVFVLLLAVASVIATLSPRRRTR